MPPRVTPVLAVEQLRKRFITRGLFTRTPRVVPAVDGVSFELQRGRTTVLLGESGCGKSTLARTILGLHRADAGRIELLGTDVAGLSEREWRPHRRHVQMVFQNPLTSFDPMQTIGAAIGETLRLAAEPPADRPARIEELLTEVGLAARFADLRPARVSGGELQRAGIARALACRPDLVVMDEPTSALDMSIQGQVLGLLGELQERHGLSYLIATHDLHAARLIAHDVLVMYLGQVVESGPADVVLERPSHPYTRGLLYAHDLAGRSDADDERVRIRGTVSFADPDYPGCRLVGRCPLERDGCRDPQELAPQTPGHAVRCWVAHDDEGSLRSASTT